VTEQTPGPGSPASRGTVVDLTLVAGAEAEATVPDLRGLALRDAVSRLSSMAIEVGRVSGTGTVVNQIPEPGTAIRKGIKCTLVLSPRGA